MDTVCESAWRLGEAVGGLDYVSVSVAFRRFQQGILRERELAALHERALTQQPNVKA